MPPLVRRASPQIGARTICACSTARLLRDAPAPDASARDECFASAGARRAVRAGSVDRQLPDARQAAAALGPGPGTARAALPAGVSLLTGPAARIDDKELVKAGWGRHARLLAPKGAASRAAAPGWTAGEDAAKLDETLKGLSDSWLGKKLAPEDEAKAHLLAGQVYAALAQADLKGRAPAAATASSSPAAAYTDGAAPAEAAVPFEPKAIYQKASKSVVLILCSANSGSGELGTGSVVDAGRRRILTNAHVVIQDSSRWAINVYSSPRNSRRYPARPRQPRRGQGDGIRLDPRRGRQPPTGRRRPA